MKKNILLILSFVALVSMSGFSQTYNVTFKVDMNQYGLMAGDIVYVNGTFNGWCGDCNPMDDSDMDGFWEVSLPLPAGAIEYKFTINGWTVQETLTEGTSCTVTNFGYTNRFHDVQADVDLGVVCWQSCDATCVDVPDAGMVTFRVDMNEYGATPGGVFINGSFNGWCGTCNPMDDSDMDGIWELTIPLTGGEIEYKFTVNGWTDQEWLTDGDVCTKTTIDGENTFINRVYMVDGDADLGTVCWASCSECAVACGIPQNVNHSLGSPANCTITWDEIPGALRYDVHYRVSGTASWTRVGSYNNVRTLYYLAPNTWYEYFVRATCDGTWDFANKSARGYFNTANTPLARETSGYATEILGINPNPATTTIRLDYTVSGTEVNISIMDMLGRTLYQDNKVEIAGSQTETIDISNLEKGYYIMVIQSGEEKIMKKFIKTQY